MKKRMTALLLALVMLLAGCTVFADETQHQPQKQAAAKPAGTVNEGATSESFSDVPEDSFYFEAVNWAVEEKITEGLTNTTFGPMPSATAPRSSPSCGGWMESLPYPARISSPM